MTEARRRIDRVLDPSFLDGIEQRETTDVRTMRAECQEEEALHSYERRLLHGRLAILRRELDRRSGAGERSLMQDLPQILADDDRPPSRGSFPGNDPQLTFEPSRRISKLLDDDSLTRLDELDDDELRARIEVLEDAEREISGTRRSLLAVLDALNAEIARRYKSGEADPSDVLTGR